MSVMTEQCCHQIVPVKPRGTCGPITGAPIEEINSTKLPNDRRKCGCLKTSDKVKQVLGTFPVPPPPTSMYVTTDKASGYTYGRCESKLPSMPCTPQPPSICCKNAEKRLEQGKSWKIVSELVTIVQVSVTAMALVLYYLIYCYMQVVYYTLKSAMYFHNADGPMKVTIGVVTATTLIIVFNLLLRMEKILAIVY